MLLDLKKLSVKTGTAPENRKNKKEMMMRL